jgi:hypothetical protein
LYHNSNASDYKHTMKIQIVNPLYDIAFKYLMEDLRIAKLILSTIIGEEIIHLQPNPQEHTNFVDIDEQIKNIKNQDEKSLEVAFSIYRLDYTATIQQADGTEKIVLLELQKAYLASNILRFREYIGNQLANPNNINWDFNNEVRVAKNAIPILPIYILGYPFSVIKDVPVIKVNRQYIDAATNEIIAPREPFIEGLSYDSIYISVGLLKGKLRTDLEKMLNIFNQKFVMSNRQLLEIDDSSVPEKFRPIVERLGQATKNTQVRQTMTYEDALRDEIIYMRNLAREEAKEEVRGIYIEEFAKAKKELNKIKEQASHVKVQLKQSIEQVTQAQEQVTQAQEQVTQAQEQVTQAQEQATQAQEQLKQSKINTIKIAQKLVAQGIQKSFVASTMSISETELEDWLLMIFE